MITLFFKEKRKEITRDEYRQNVYVRFEGEDNPNVDLFYFVRRIFFGCIVKNRQIFLFPSFSLKLPKNKDFRCAITFYFLFWEIRIQYVKDWSFLERSLFEEEEF